MPRNEAQRIEDTGAHIPLDIFHGPYLPLNMEGDRPILNEILEETGTELSDLAIQSLWQLELQGQTLLAETKLGDSRDSIIQMYLLGERIEQARDDVYDWVECPGLMTLLHKKAKSLTSKP